MGIYEDVAWNRKGKFLINERKFGDAIIAYEKSIMLNRSVISSWSNLAVALFFLSRYRETILACDQAIGLDPDLAIAWNNKGIAFFSLERYNDAIDSYNKAIQLNPKFYRALNNRGITYVALGKTQDAKKSFDNTNTINDLPCILGEIEGRDLYILKSNISPHIYEEIVLINPAKSIELMGDYLESTLYLNHNDRVRPLKVFMSHKSALEDF